MKRILLAVAAVCLVCAGGFLVFHAPSSDKGPGLPASFLGSDALAAADSCTNWMKQPNKCSWRTCVDSKGRQYCQEACGNRINKVRC